ncbi:MAG: MFS transporter [Chloroflexi bacterium]|nr:MFS transporter [Chloroflexota bacterium]
MTADNPNADSPAERPSPPANAAPSPGDRPAPAAHGARSSMRAVLALHDFRMLLVMQFASTVRQPMLFFAQAWYVNIVAPESQRVFLLGVLGAVRGGTFLAYALFGGAIADRFPRGRALMISHVASLIVTAGIGLLLYVPAVARGEGPWLWVMFPLFATFGLATGQDQPTRTAMVRDVVPASALTSAIMWHQLLMALAFIPAAPFSGWAIDRLGFATTYMTSGIGHVVVIIALLAMRSPGAVADPGAKRESVLQNLRGGFTVMREDPVVRWTILLTWVVLAAALSVMGILIAAWVHDILLLDATGWGWMALWWGIGGVVSSVWLTWQADSQRKGALFLGSCALMGVAVLAFGVSRSLPAAFFWNGMAGLANSLVLTLGIALVQEMVPNRVLGRVTALLMLSQGFLQVAGLGVALIAQAVGLPLIYPAAGVLILAVTLVATIAQRPLRNAH